MIFTAFLISMAVALGVWAGFHLFATALFWFTVAAIAIALGALRVTKNWEGGSMYGVVVAVVLGVVVVVAWISFLLSGGDATILHDIGSSLFRQ